MTSTKLDIPIWPQGRYKVSKVIVVGDPSVGKTSLLHRFSTDTFSYTYKPTVGIDFVMKDVLVGDSEHIKLHLWDTAGTDKFDAITTNYYRAALGAILVYDVTNRYSYQKIPYWAKKIEENCRPGIPKFLVGNKMDQTIGRVINIEEARLLASFEGLMMYETSARTGENVNTLYKDLAKTLILTKCYTKERSTYLSIDEDNPKRCGC